MKYCKKPRLKRVVYEDLNEQKPWMEKEDLLDAETY